MLSFVYKGRAERAEYWWFFLFTFLVGFIVSLIDLLLGTSITISDMGTINESDDQRLGIFTSIAQIILLLPGLAVGARRLHDTNRTGWWQLLWITPILISIPLIIINNLLFEIANMGLLIFLSWPVGWIILIVFLALPSTNHENNNNYQFEEE